MKRQLNGHTRQFRGIQGQSNAEDVWQLAQ